MPLGVVCVVVDRRGNSSTAAQALRRVGVEVEGVRHCHDACRVLFGYCVVGCAFSREAPRRCLSVGTFALQLGTRRCVGRFAQRLFA